MSDPPPICEVVGSGWLFPITQFEVDMPNALRAVIYSIMMTYFFLGVSIIADIFMSSIDEVTSRRNVKLCGNYARAPKVWNPTVATLSLMALGSSAPEIFLAVVEILKKEFNIGPLGTSTIIGSAAFNLLVIIAVCIGVIPAGEVRCIKDLPAFYITAFWSIFAYIWLAIIVNDNVVHWWEALLTLLFLPMFIWISYKADVGGLDDIGVRLHLMNPRTPESKVEVLPRIEIKQQSKCGIKNQYLITQNKSDQKLDITVTCSGEAKAGCKFKTERVTAVPGYHYNDKEGEIKFRPGQQREQKIEIDICGGHANIERSFLLILSDQEGAEFEPLPGSSKDESILLATILPAAPKDEHHQMRKTSLVLLEARVGSVFGARRAIDEWKVQFSEAIYCGGSLEDQAESSIFDYICHLIAMPWKILFSIAPPVYVGGGWARFTWSLMVIAGITMIVSDLAELFGCVLDIPDISAALVFVALGTSMPDLFASLSAAKEDPTADASILNVTGSNAVNVFLGVGVPYLLASIHWELKGEKLTVQTDGLVFCIICFCCVCGGGLVLLHARRKLVGCELGGPVIPKFFCSGVFVCMWVSFVGMSSWRVLQGRSVGVSGSEEIVAALVLGGGVVVLTSICIGVLFKYRVDGSDEDLEDEAYASHESEAKEASKINAAIASTTAAELAPRQVSHDAASKIPRSNSDPFNPPKNINLFKAMSRSLSSVSSLSFGSVADTVSSASSGQQKNRQTISARKRVRERLRSKSVAVLSPGGEEDPEQQGPTPALIRGFSRSKSNLGEGDTSPSARLPDIEERPFSSEGGAESQQPARQVSEEVRI